MTTSGRRVAIITGAGGGIGRAAALHLARDGCEVHVVDINDDLLAETVDLLRGAGSTATATRADVSRLGDVRRYYDEAVSAHGDVDVFVNNAGVEGPIARIGEYGEEAFDRVMAVNVKGVYLGLHVLLPAMVRAGRGAIVNTASVGGLSGAIGMAGYIASKHAVIGLTRVAAAEGGPHGVRVNALCPGPVDTRMMRSIERDSMPDDPERARRAVAAIIPLGRYSMASEQAEVITFLASDAASYVNGAAWLVDGGQLATPGGLPQGAL